MAILQQCPSCRKRQSIKNKKCNCSQDLDKAKRSNRVNYHVDYRLHNGKQRREFVGKSIEDAKALDGEKKSLKKKKPGALKISGEEKMTFQDLADWYLDLEKVKAMKYYKTLQYNLNSFNAEFGDMVIAHLKPVDLENYQAKRTAAGKSDSYIDQEIGAMRTAINKAFDNDILSIEPVGTFKKVKRLLKRNANARNRILSLDEFKLLMSKLPKHTKAILATGFLTGMRKGEILSLTWDRVDLKKRVIYLEAEDTKDKEARKVPISDNLFKVLVIIPRYIHDNHVFLYARKPVRDIRAGLIKACKDANIIYGRKVVGGFVYHDLRHSFNTHMRKAGVAESVIMEITGHSTREMFDRYNRVDMEDSRKAVDQMDLFLENVDQVLTRAKKMPS
jgi:integrase